MKRGREREKRKEKGKEKEEEKRKEKRKGTQIKTNNNILKRMLRITAPFISHFHTVFPTAKDSGYGRLFRSPSLYEVIFYSFFTSYYFLFVSFVLFFGFVF